MSCREREREGGCVSVCACVCAYVTARVCVWEWWSGVCLPLGAYICAFVCVLICLCIYAPVLCMIALPLSLSACGRVGTFNIMCCVNAYLLVYLCAYMYIILCA